MDYYISFGSNINPEENIQAMLDLVRNLPGLKLVQVSSLYKTAPWGKVDQDAFINGAMHLTSDLKPKELFPLLQDVERKLGRQRLEKWGPRTIDLDIVWVEDDQQMVEVKEKDLVIPHPYFWERNFVLIPLGEIYKDFVYNGEKIQTRIATLGAE